MMSATELESAIKATVKDLLDPQKVDITYVESVDENGVLTQKTFTRKALPPTIDAEQAVIDAIAKAVAKEVIEHLKNKLELQMGSASYMGGSESGTWIGSGGGVVGPVTVVTGQGVTGSETLSITAGKFT